ncbi:MAG: type II secretion system protein [Gammaproteobacteria bacterium]|nr:type II secretion system protein [Gammaproteobacteria bacterium]
MSRPCTQRTGRQRGFTLLEVLVAFVILLLAFSVLMRIFATGGRGLVAAADVNRAVAYAEAEIAAVGVTEPLATGTSDGELDDGYRWERVIELYPTEESDTSARVPLLYRVTTTVHWERHGKPRELRLQTLRLGPMPDSVARVVN